MGAAPEVEEQAPAVSSSSSSGLIPTRPEESATDVEPASGRTSTAQEQEAVPASGESSQGRAATTSVTTSSSSLNTQPAADRGSVTKVPVQCSVCGGPWKGWGPTCSECRKSKKAAPSAPAASGDQCAICQKKVYVLEKVEVSGVTLHKDCFRCAKCNIKLSLGKFSKADGLTFYCPTHFKEIFRLRGRYDSTAAQLASAHSNAVNSSSVAVS